MTDIARALLDAAPVCCCLFGENLNIADCNDGAVCFLGCSDKDAVLEGFNNFSPPHQPNGQKSETLFREYLAEALKTDKIRFEWLFRRADGMPMPAEITLVRLTLSDGFAVAAYARDMRECKAALEEMRVVEKELKRAVAAAEQNAAAKTEFLANMSHEIRTPMNGVLGMLSLLQSTPLDRRQENYVLKAENAAKELMRLLTDVLDYAKMDSGIFNMDAAEFALEEVIDELRAVYAPKAAAKKLSFEIELEKGVPLKLRGYPIPLNQALFNLLYNALKFTEKGGITLSVKQEYRSGKIITLHFTVKDTGIGMAEEQVRKLFTPFLQVDNSTSRRYGGAGLGLSLTRNLVNLMRGDIWCQSVLGKGSEFHFTAQFTADASDDSGLPHTKYLSSKDRFAGCLALLVDDNEINQATAGEILSAAGFSVDTASNGKEALEMLAQKYYDAVLMDIQMPVLDGYEATAAIRKNPRYNKIPVIAMTAYAMAGDRERALELGFNEYLTKPIDPAALYAALQGGVKRN